jgi:hypothetical protein
MSGDITIKGILKSLFYLPVFFAWLGVAYAERSAEEGIVKFDNIESASNYVLSLAPSDQEASKKIESLLAYIIRAQGFREEFLMTFEERASPTTNSTLMTPAGYYVSTVSIHYPGCFAVHPIDSSPFLAVIPNSNPPVPFLEGICVILSVIHSAVDRLKVVKKEEVLVNGSDVSKDLLNQMKLATSNPYDWGTRYSEIPKLYKKLIGKRVDCKQSSFKAGGVKATCKELNRFLAEGYDCNLELGFTALGSSGHLVNISAAEPMSGDSCQIVVVDTGKQGDGRGNNVPYDRAGYQHWSIQSKSNSSGISVHNFKGDDRRIWNAAGFSASEYRCCKIVD